MGFTLQATNLLHNPQLGGPEQLSLSDTYPFICSAWKALPVATLPPAYSPGLCYTQHFCRETKEGHEEIRQNSLTLCQRF